MKKLLILLALCCVAFFVKAQDVTPTFAKGDKVANIGIGLGTGLSSYYKMAIPPISLSAEYGILDGILEKGSVGVGAYLGYSSYSYKYISDYGWKESRLYIGPRGSFHYPLVDKLDTYVGLSFGLSYYRYKYDDSYYSIFGDLSGSTTDGYSYWFVGARYYFTDNMAVMAELGYGITYLNVGIAIKL